MIQCVGFDDKGFGNFFQSVEGFGFYEIRLADIAERALAELRQNKEGGWGEREIREQVGVGFEAKGEHCRFGVKISLLLLKIFGLFNLR